MAEARSAVHVVDEQKRGIRVLQVTDDGVVFSFSLTIPHPETIKRSIQHRIHRFLNAVKKFFITQKKQTNPLIINFQLLFRLNMDSGPFLLFFLFLL